MNDEAQTHHHAPRPHTRAVHRHIVKRCTNEESAARAMDDAAANGYKLIEVGVSTSESVWLFFQKTTTEVVQPQAEAAPAAPAPVGRSFSD